MKGRGCRALRLGLVAVFGGQLALALTAGPAVAKDRPENECLIGVEDENGTLLSGKVTCTDCDPACDADGEATANGSCTFRIRGCLNIAGIAGCTQRPLKKFSFKTPFAPNTIVVKPVEPTSASSVCGSFVGLTVPLKKKGKKPGTRRIKASATADVRPFGKNKDQDKVTFVCNPLPAGQTCPTLPTSTTTTSSTSTSEPPSTATSTSTSSSTSSLPPTTSSSTSTSIPSTTTTSSSTTTSTPPTTTASTSTSTSTTGAVTTSTSTTTTEAPTTSTSTSTTTTTLYGSPSRAFVERVAGLLE